MEIYKNLSGSSGVVAYEIGPDWIAVRFRSGSPYLYNYSVTGSQNVEQMKALATAGKGLCTFISTTVRDRYAGKIR